MKLEYNSSKNQDIKRQFINNEVLANVGNMVNYIINQDDFRDAPFNYDDIENLYIDNTEEIEELEKLLDDEKTTYSNADSIREQINELEGMEQEPRDWYESYIVTGYLANKLVQKGELVIPHMNIWLRQTTGQAILLDSVISEICEDMEILEGQAKSWENY